MQRYIINAVKDATDWVNRVQTIRMQKEWLTVSKSGVGQRWIVVSRACIGPWSSRTASTQQNRHILRHDVFIFFHEDRPPCRKRLLKHSSPLLQREWRLGFWFRIAKRCRLREWYITPVQFFHIPCCCIYITREPNSSKSCSLKISPANDLLKFGFAPSLLLFC